MVDVVKIYLENEMDLILAQQRGMKLAEFAGLSLSEQTSFGTAVSEVCRYVLDKKNATILTLGIKDGKGPNALVAKVHHNKKGVEPKDEAILFAGRLADSVTLSNTKTGGIVEMEEKLSPRSHFSPELLDEWKKYFRNQAPISPYEEVKQKNIQLKELTLKLEQSEKQYKTLAESLPLIIYTTNENGEVVYVNNWLQQFAGVGPEEVKKNGWASLIHADDVLNMQPGSSGLHNVSAEYRIKNKQGEYVWHTGITVPVAESNQAGPGEIGFFADIHAQKLVEQTLKDNKELKEAQEQLAVYQAELEARIEELNRSNLELAQFAYVASHDLQEPLRKLMIYADTVQTKFAQHINPDVKFMLSRMLESCRRMRLLILDLLNFSKIRKEELLFTQVGLERVIAAVLNNLEASLTEKNAQVHVGKMPVIEASMQHMGQLFENLIGNSLKYARKDVAPVIFVEAEQQPNNNWVIYVKDNGIGFENKYNDRIFGLFQRLHNKNEFEGTGIGLAICKKITDLHNGSIKAEGKPGEGSIFAVSLPANQQK